ATPLVQLHLRARYTATPYRAARSCCSWPARASRSGCVACGWRSASRRSRTPGPPPGSERTTMRSQTPGPSRSARATQRRRACSTCERGTRRRLTPYSAPTRRARSAPCESEEQSPPSLGAPFPLSDQRRAERLPLRRQRHHAENAQHPARSEADDRGVGRIRKLEFSELLNPHPRCHPRRTNLHSFDGLLSDDVCAQHAMRFLRDDQFEEALGVIVNYSAV